MFGPGGNWSLWELVKAKLDNLRGRLTEVTSHLRLSSSFGGRSARSHASAGTASSGGDAVATATSDARPRHLRPRDAVRPRFIRRNRKRSSRMSWTGSPGGLQLLADRFASPPAPRRGGGGGCRDNGGPPTRRSSFSFFLWFSLFAAPGGESQLCSGCRH